MFAYCYCRVSDEKEARGYLQALATKMTEELEALKPPSGYGTLSRVSKYGFTVTACLKGINLSSVIDILQQTSAHY